MRKFILIAMALIFVVGCGSSNKVYRIDPETTTDLSGKWNDTDARLVAEEMVSDCLSRPWLSNFVDQNGKMPVVTVGEIRNLSSEHIDTDMFTTDFERELTNSGRVTFVARPTQRNELREERFDQKEFASPETVKQIRNETGADFMLVGQIISITDQAEGTQVVSYKTNLQLINVETMVKAWIGDKEIKKEIGKSKTKW